MPPLFRRKNFRTFRLPLCGRGVRRAPIRAACVLIGSSFGGEDGESGPTTKREEAAARAATRRRRRQGASDYAQVVSAANSAGAGIYRNSVSWTNRLISVSTDPIDYVA
jgi:hypothetical protein